jgi:acyl carrier protein
MDIAEKTRLLAEMLEVDISEVQADKQLESLSNWDSMAALSLIALLEEHFGRSDIDGTQIRQMKKVSDIFEVMER